MGICGYHNSQSLNVRIAFCIPFKAQETEAEYCYLPAEFVHDPMK